jgi:hypothetical protein
LAGEQAAADGDHHTAFARYDRALRDYVSKGQRLAKGNAIGLIPRSRSQVWLRNQFIRALPYMPWRGLLAGGVQKAANAITLKDYRDGTPEAGELRVGRQRVAAVGAAEWQGSLGAEPVPGSAR